MNRADPCNHGSAPHACRLCAVEAERDAAVKRVAELYEALASMERWNATGAALDAANAALLAAQHRISDLKAEVAKLRTGRRRSPTGLTADGRPAMASELEQAIERLTAMAERWNATTVWHEPRFTAGRINVTTEDLWAASVVVPLLARLTGPIDTHLFGATPTKETGR